ncbi:MAG: RdgB/HAM1 family non-canonical purine NTP pyrophosphatase [Bacteroidetes bacterium]|nr:RdgB/HAM1 family non-canonical purine NTP pyrophosphatase [Bacteroidota bacterium]
MTKTLLIATHNRHKASELKEMLQVNFRILDLQDAGFHEPIPETGHTFHENAWQKCKTLTAHFPDYWVLTDDSGLEVDALNGEPGVFSARYAGASATDNDNVQLLLHNLQSIENRKAAFICVLCLCSPAGSAEYFEGRVEGHIALEPSGQSGFGYDPVFLPAGQTLTFAQMDSAEKNAMSHRNRAVTLLAQRLRMVE